MQSIKTKGGQSVRTIVNKILQENEKKIRNGRNKEECCLYVAESLEYLGKMFTFEYK